MTISVEMLERENMELRRVIDCMVCATHPADREVLIVNTVELLCERRTSRMEMRDDAVPIGRRRAERMRQACACQTTEVIATNSYRCSLRGTVLGDVDVYFPALGQAAHIVGDFEPEDIASVLYGVEHGRS